MFQMSNVSWLPAVASYQNRCCAIRNKCTDDRRLSPSVLAHTDLLLPMLLKATFSARALNIFSRWYITNFNFHRLVYTRCIRCQLIRANGENFSAKWSAPILMGDCFGLFTSHTHTCAIYLFIAGLRFAVWKTDGVVRNKIVKYVKRLMANEWKNGVSLLNMFSNLGKRTHISVACLQPIQWLKMSTR